MRRLLSILLLAAFALPMVAPMFALAQDSDSNLPACCRRHGQHHCTMPESERDPSAHRVVAVCPAWPQHAVPVPVAYHHFLTHHSTSGVFLHTTILFLANREPDPRHIPERLHPKRGPPVCLLA